MINFIWNLIFIFFGFVLGFIVCMYINCSARKEVLRELKFLEADTKNECKRVINNKNDKNLGI